MNIVFFIQNFDRPAGSERVTALIANELSKKGHIITILSICGSNKSYFELEENIQLYTLIREENVNNRKAFFMVLKEYRNFLKSHKVDYVIDVFAALSIYTILLKRKKRFKNITWEHFNYTANVGMNKLGRKLAKRYSDKIVTLTETDRKMYISQNKRLEKKVVSVFNPSPYQEPEKTDILCREKIILSVGRLTNQKSFDRMLYVWKNVNALLGKKAKEWKLIILGEGEEREKLEQIIKDNNLYNVVLPGTVKNVKEYYMKSILYLSTSLYEGLPMTMIEAQSFGIPIVSLNYLTGPQDIISNGVNGIIVPDMREDKQLIYMAKEIARLIQDKNLLNIMSTNSYRSRERFRTDIIIKQWIDLLETGD